MHPLLNMIKRLVNTAEKIFGFNTDLTILDIPLKDLYQIIPNDSRIPVTFIDYQYIYGNVPIEELVVLAKIVRFFKPKKILEIGTYLGNTTLQLAANSKAKIFTLDLPPQVSQKKAPYEILDPQLDVYPSNPGIKFKKSSYSSRIKQLYGNSIKYNFSKFKGKIDLVFVDGSHHYKYIRKDSINAIQLLSPHGIIIWHDYSSYAPDVIRVLNDLGRKLPLIHLKNTRLILYKS